MQKTKYSVPLAGIIRDLRIKNGFSIEYVAQKIKIQPRRIQKAEAGYELTFCEVFALAEIYRIELSDMLKLLQEKMDGE